ncbi:hypothetical protein [Sandaracinobacteroides hominis]|uniref:hypothetical protein n=1 Tax=Sandaracinobacteroides hominis TaxID=2780086 RepID=UPI0018F38DE0|nr:hypothetical protein [Sandaracinobacteroides hominis]
MRSVLKYSISATVAFIAASPAFASASAVPLDFLLEPHTWVFGVAALAMVGLAAGNGIGSREKAPKPRPYAPHLTMQHPVPANEAGQLADAA